MKKSHSDLHRLAVEPVVRPRLRPELPLPLDSAVSYYLSPNLAVQMSEVFLRSSLFRKFELVTSSADFRGLASRIGAVCTIEEVDESSIFCEIVVP